MKDEQFTASELGDLSVKLAAAEPALPAGEAMLINRLIAQRKAVEISKIC